MSRSTRPLSERIRDSHPTWLDEGTIKAITRAICSHHIGLNQLASVTEVLHPIYKVPNIGVWDLSSRQQVSHSDEWTKFHDLFKWGFSERCPGLFSYQVSSIAKDIAFNYAIFCFQLSNSLLVQQVTTGPIPTQWRRTVRIRTPNFLVQSLIWNVCTSTFLIIHSFTSLNQSLPMPQFMLIISAAIWWDGYEWPKKGLAATWYSLQFVRWNYEHSSNSVYKTNSQVLGMYFSRPLVWLRCHSCSNSRAN